LRALFTASPALLLVAVGLQRERPAALGVAMSEESRLQAHALFLAGIVDGLQAACDSLRVENASLKEELHIAQQEVLNLGIQLDQLRALARG
jgi:hypothetical protein